MFQHISGLQRPLWVEKFCFCFIGVLPLIVYIGKGQTGKYTEGGKGLYLTTELRGTT